MSKRVCYNPILMHYGVKGMKWGVRHDREKVGQRNINKKSNAPNKKGLSKASKIALGAIACAGVLGVSVYLYKSGKFNTLANIGKSAVKGISTNQSKSIMPTIGHAERIAGKIKPLNGKCNYNSFAASLNNKVNISLKPNAAYEGNVNTFLNRALKNPDKHIFDTVPKDVYRDEVRLSSTIKRIAKNTDGACGQIASDLSNGRGGHAFNWKIENGVVKYYDTHAQISPGVYKPVEDASIYIKSNLISGNNGKITRLDNITKNDLNLDYLKDKFIIG